MVQGVKCIFSKEMLNRKYSNKERKGEISQDATGSDCFFLAAWLRLLIKRESIELLFAIFFFQSSF